MKVQMLGGGGGVCTILAPQAAPKASGPCLVIADNSSQIINCPYAHIELGQIE